MILKRYIVEVTPEQARELSAEHVELATRISRGETELLIYRDRFVAYKIATLSGGTFSEGQVVDGDVQRNATTLTSPAPVLEQATA